VNPPPAGTAPALDVADRLSLRAAARSFLTDALPANGRPPEADPAGLDRPGWRRMAGELGLQGVRFSEADGGSGLGLDAELLVHEELGRVLSSVPYLSTVATVGGALRALGDAAGDVNAGDVNAGDVNAGDVNAGDVAELRQAIVAGELVAAALLEPVSANNHSGQLRLSGEQECVIDAGVAHALLVLAHRAGGDGSDGGGAVLAWVSTDADGVTIEPLPAIDLTRRFARVNLRDAPARILAEGAAASAAAAAARVGFHLGLSAECIGAAARALELTVDYVKVRHQFGRAIGSFQAVKHKCAEMLVQLEGARSALALAARAAGGPNPRRAAAALAVARTHCGERCFWIANEAIHLHGGIGFTWEHPAHLYYRRAKSNQQLLDPGSTQRQLLAELVAAQYEEEANAR
jgi:alkylation response protein AidB-like acyl-CoA dehydrogenase